MTLPTADAFRQLVPARIIDPGRKARQAADSGVDRRRGEHLLHPRLPTLYLCPPPASAPLLGRPASARAPWGRWVLGLCLGPPPRCLSSEPPAHLRWIVRLPSVLRFPLTAWRAPCRAPGAVFAVYPVPVHLAAHRARLLVPWRRAREGLVRGFGTLSDRRVVVVCVLCSTSWSAVRPIASGVETRSP